jgi:hypothetical protein
MLTVMKLTQCVIHAEMDKESNERKEMVQKPTYIWTLLYNIGATVEQWEK